MSKVKPDNQTKPERLAGETDRPFRLRAIVWILDSNPAGLDYEGIQVHLRADFAEEMREIARDTIIRDMKVLEARDEVYSEKSEDDNRKTIWLTYEE